MKQSKRKLSSHSLFYVCSFRRSSPLAARGARRPTITRCHASWCSKLRSNVTWASMPASSSHPPGSSRCHARWEHTHSIIIPPFWLIKMPHKVRTHAQHHHPSLLAHQDATQGENTHTASSSLPPGSSRCHARWELTQHHHPTFLAHQDATQGENTHTASSSHPPGSSGCHARWEHTHGIIIPPSWLIKMPRKVRTHTASSSHPPGSSRCHARWEHTHSIIIPPSWLIKMPRKVRTHTQHHHPTLLAHQDATQGENTHTAPSSHPPSSSRCHARWEHTHSIIIPPSWLIKMPRKVRTHTQHHHPTLLAHQDATQGENTHTAPSSHPSGSSRCHARWELTQHHHPTLLAHQDATQGENTHTASSSHPSGSSRCHARWEHTHSIIIPPSWLIKMPRKVRTHTQHHHPTLLAHQDATQGENTHSIIIPPSWLIKMPCKVRTHTASSSLSPGSSRCHSKSGLCLLQDSKDPQVDID